MSNVSGKSSFLEVRSLHKSFTSGKGMLHVLKGIDFTVDRGEVLVIIGPSGAGKSTLLHIMGALDRPASGSVLLDGEDLFSLSESALSRVRNQRVGFVFQFYHLLPEFTALENVMMPALVYFRGSLSDRGACEKRANELLEAVGIAGRSHHRPSELSGGEQQRVAIARALMNKPCLVLADEPSGNLDMITSEEIHRLIAVLNRKFGQTFVIVTHDELLTGGADRRLKMIDGKIVEG